MRIQSKYVNYAVLFLVNGLYGMQAPEVEITKILELSRSNNRAKIIMQLADVRQNITEKDILEASKCLDDSLFGETIDATSRETLNVALFRIAQAAIAVDEEKIKIAEILVDAGANHRAQFSVEETLPIKNGAQYSQTSHCFQSDAKREAKGKLKEYLDSIK